MEQPKHKGKHRTVTENEIIRRRERESRHNELWGGTVKYFDHWSKANTKFDEWTSPRYYSENNKLLSDIRTKREKEELLEKRRERLRKLLEDERKSYDIELMVHKNRYIVERPKRVGDVSTTVLKEVNDNLKSQEEAIRRKEAETKLFNQWRRNNPLVRQYEAKYKCKDLKLSWLDQQIEKRMQKEKEEEDTKKYLKEIELKRKLDEEKEEEYKKQLEENEKKIKEALDEQMKELLEKQKLADELKSIESEDLKQKMLLEELEHRRKLEEKRRQERECALFNIQQHNRRLKQKARDVQENLQQERELMLKLKELQLADIIEEETKRNEIKQGIQEYLDLLKQQQALDAQREKRLDFLFESEAKSVYDMQAPLWAQEESARNQLVSDVINCVKEQINNKLETYKEQQRQNLLERERTTEKIEKYYKEMEKMKEDAEKRKREAKESREEEIKTKMALKKQQEGLKMKELDEELEKIKREEERLQKEILRIQERHGPYRPPNRRFLL